MNASAGRTSPAWRLVLPVLCLAAMACGRDVVQLDAGFDAERRVVSVEMSVDAEADLLLYAGRPWTGEDAVLPQGPGLPLLRLVGPRPVQSAERAAPGATTRLEIPARALRELPDPCVLQAVASREGRSVGTSAAILVRRARDDPWCRPYEPVTVRRALGRAAFSVGLPLLAIVVLALLRLPGPRSARAVHGVLAVLLALALGSRLIGDVERQRVERGLDHPPLLWPLTWSLDDDILERTLGPGFRQLEHAILTTRTGEESLVVWTGQKGIDVARATYLARSTGGEVRLLAPGTTPTGLSVFVGIDPSGDVLASTDAGALCRSADG